MKRLEWSLLSEDDSASILFAFSRSTCYSLHLRPLLIFLFLQDPNTSSADRGACFGKSTWTFQYPRPHLLAQESQSCSQGRN